MTGYGRVLRYATALLLVMNGAVFGGLTMASTARADYGVGGDCEAVVGESDWCYCGGDISGEGRCLDSPVEVEVDCFLNKHCLDE